MEHIDNVLGRLDRGKAIPNQKTTELEMAKPTLGQRREDLRKSLWVSSLDNTFANFKPVKGTEKALAAFKALAEGKTRWKMLLCYGGVGNGKTHLCEATAITLYKRGIFCRVLTMAEIMRMLKHSIAGTRTEFGYLPTPYDELLERFCSWDFLIIDDVGMGGSGSEWEYGQLEEIITFRYRERLFTVMTTNRDLSELPERIVSRFQDPDVGRAILNEGTDFRRLK